MSPTEVRRCQLKPPLERQDQTTHHNADTSLLPPESTPRNTGTSPARSPDSPFSMIRENAAGGSGAWYSSPSYQLRSVCSVDPAMGYHFTQHTSMRRSLRRWIRQGIEDSRTGRPPVGHPAVSGFPPPERNRAQASRE